MADDVKNVASETPADTSPPTEQNAATNTDANSSTEKSGGLMQGISDALSNLKDSITGNKDKTNKDETNKDETQKDETKNNSTDDIKSEVSNVLDKAGDLTGTLKDAIQTAAENVSNATSQSSVAQQMKELGEVQVDKAFVNDSLNMLGTLSFDQLIGGPLRAAVKAQRDLAKETLSYIREEGLTTDDNGESKVTYVTLNFVRNGKQVKMRVPLLTLMPVPRLSITTMTYTFKARVNAQSAVVASVGSVGSPVLAQQTDTTGTPKDSAASNNLTGTQKQSASSSDTTASDTDTDKTTDKTTTASETTTKTTAASTTTTTTQTAQTATTTSAPTFSASLSSKKDSGATRDSRYSIETTMDISITASEGDMPCGIDRLLNVLDSSAEEYDPTGTLQVSADQTSLVGGYAALTVNYRDGMGTFQPQAIGCSPLESNGKQPSLLTSGNDMLLVFNTKGAYKITAGSLQRIVFVS